MEQAAAASTNTSEKIRILFIEDSRIDFVLMESALMQSHQAGLYEIEHVKTVKSGLFCINEKKHDLYFVDYNLPDGTALDLFNALNPDEDFAPFIILTATDRPDLYKELARKNVYDYLIKNEVSTSSLDRTITHALERKRIEAQLRTEQQRNAAIIEEMPYIVLELSADKRIINTNSAIFEITGYNIDEIIGTTWDELHLEDHSTSPDEEWLSGSVENKIWCKNKDIKTIEWTQIQLDLDNNADEKTFLFVGKDITPDIESNKRKRREEKLESLGFLAGGLAHEMSNLIQPQIFSIDLYKRDKDISADPDLEKLINIIEKNTRQAKSLIDSVRTFSKVEQAPEQGEELIPILREAIDFSLSLIPSKFSLGLKGLKKKDSYLAKISKNELIQVISNILKNAFEAIESDGDVSLQYTVVFPDAKKAKRLQINEGKPYAKIIIKNNGPQIPQDHLDNIFDPFFTTKGATGQGLGLPIVHNTVLRWDGAIHVDSTDEATSFLIYIPVFESEEKK